MRSFSILAALSLGVLLVAADPMLDQCPVYVPAAGIVPGIPATLDHGASPWIQDASPASWPVVDLNGAWQVSAHPDTACVDYQTIDRNYGPLRIPDLLKSEQAFVGWRVLPVPWPESFRPGPDGKPADFSGVVYYRRSVTLPDYDPTVQEPVLVFGGAGYRTDVWIESRYLGFHLGQWARFEFPLTDMVRPKAIFPLLVKCVDTRYGQRWHGRLSVGIFDPVRIEIRPIRALRGLRTRITPDLTALELSWSLPEHSAHGRAHLTAAITPATNKSTVASVEQDIDLSVPGYLRIPVTDAHRWTPDDPFLHRVTIALDGVEVGTRRFGWRTVGISAGTDGKQRIVLNGIPFWMRAFEFDYYWPIMKEAAALGVPDRERFGLNCDGRLREALKVLKFANINTVRPHSMYGFHQETFYNLCDEEGILVYLDWGGGEPVQSGSETDNAKTRALAGLATYERNRDAFTETIQALHDHPSLAFISFGNEMYDGSLPDGRTWDGLISRYRATLSRSDWQGRPGSGSTGRPVWDHQEPVDFVDHHQYIGVYYGSWRNIVPYLVETSALIRRRFGAALPFVNMETGDVMDFRVHDRNVREMRELLATPIPTREQKVALIKALSGANELDSFLRLAIQQGGLRDYLTDLPAFRHNRATVMVKRYLELFRRERAYTDGVSLNSGFCEIAGRADPDSGLHLQPWPNDGVLRLADPVWAFREAYAPIQALMDPINPHPLCGAPPCDEIVTVVNDTLAPVNVAVTARLLHADGRSRDLGRLDGIAVIPAGLTRKNLRIEVPADWPSGSATIELTVLRDRVAIASNHYELQLLGSTDRRTVFPKTTLALYEPTPAATGSTGAILDHLGIAYTRLTGFAELGRYRVLIIGANQFDARLCESGEPLNRWIQDGGRLLCFEQTTSGGIPWIADERVMKLGCSTQMEVLASRHPIFAGCAGYMQWTAPGGGDSSIFETCLDLTEGMLAIAAVGHPADSSGAKAVVSDRRMGRGESLVSMIGTLKRFGTDAVVTRYVENCLAYILGDGIAPEALDAGTLGARTAPIMTLANAEALYLDLRPVMNRGLTDEVAGDGQGGWTDYGKAFEHFPRNFHRFDNLLPFWMVQPEDNRGNACIVLRGPTREQFPAATAPFAVGARLEKLYFLHTLMYVRAKVGEPVLTYEVAYADGSTTSIDLRNQIDIADWWMAKDLPNGQVLYREGDKAMYCTAWINPTPKVAISTITIRSRDNAIPIVLAVTGKKIFEQHIDKTE